MNIAQSVGRAGVNLKPDVQMVQALLNVSREDSGLTLLDLDGVVGALTISAIEAFQSSALTFVDGRVDPDQATISALLALVETTGVDLKASMMLAMVLSYEPVEDEPPPEEEPALNSDLVVSLNETIFAE